VLLVARPPRTGHGGDRIIAIHRTFIVAFDAASPTPRECGFVAPGIVIPIVAP
jgi:hypothetical protein